jgi:inhibitor of KinA sporulation pathway (predicted exonuclease)
MASLYDRIVVVDVEATCWEGMPPPGQQSEIIEIGVCTLDPETRERGESASILVRPERSRVSPFCTELTTLTQGQVDQGIRFADACALLQEDYCSRERVWASYGQYDRGQFERQCESLYVEYPFGAEHLNVKALFAEIYGLPRQVGMGRALRTLKLPLEGTHHRGGDDAWNIAAILAWLLERRSLEVLLAMGR